MLLIGCTVLGTGVAMLLAADLGSDGYSTFVNGLTLTTGVDFWIMNLVVGAVLVALAMLRKVIPGVGTVVQVVLVGVVVDVALGLMATPDDLVWRGVLLSAAFPVLAVGIALYLGSHTGAGPAEAAALAWDPPVAFKWSYSVVQGGGALGRLAPGRHDRRRHARGDLPPRSRGGPGGPDHARGSPPAGGSAGRAVRPSLRDMLIVEELFLLMRRDDGKPASATAQRGYGLAAAVITDLVLAERITLSDDKDPRMSVLVPGPVGHPALDAAMARLEQRDGKKLSSLVTDGKLNVEQQVAAALASAGVIGIEEKRALGLVPAKYPVVDPEPERRTREQLRLVLAGRHAADRGRHAAGHPPGLGVVPKVLAEEKGTLGRRDLKRRIEEVSSEVKAGRRRRQGDRRDERGDHDGSDHPGHRRGLFRELTESQGRRTLRKGGDPATGAGRVRRSARRAGCSRSTALISILRGLAFSATGTTSRRTPSA